MFELYQLEQLHLSQSALSRSMQRLEAELQVPLFTRQKNRIELNECGRMAVEHARRIVEQARDMAFRVQAFDRSQRTILVGSCAPAPLWEIPPLLSGLYPDRIISSELREPEALLSGLGRASINWPSSPSPWRKPGWPVPYIRKSTCSSPCPRPIPCRGARACT